MGLHEILSISFVIFLHFSVLSMMAIGGGVIPLAPEMRRFVVDTHGWMTDASFLESFTLAQIAPGPNMLFVTLVGLQAAGLIGAVSATVAIIFPPTVFALLLLRSKANRPSSPAFRDFQRTFLPLSIGMVAATAWSLGEMVLVSRMDAILFIVAVVVLAKWRINPVWLIAAGGMAGVTGLIRVGL